MDSAFDSTIAQLINIEAHVHYGEPPPPEAESFVVIERDSPVLLSAPHGTRTFRNSADQKWHEEDEFTAGMALLIAERCGTSAIANIWRSDGNDPNFHREEKCGYKQRLRQTVQAKNIRFVVDLHGAAENSPKLGVSLVDLGTRKALQSLPVLHRDHLRSLIHVGFGEKSVSIDGFAAENEGTITGFCQTTLKVQAIQIEMKPSVRVPVRRTDASAFGKLGPFSAPPGNVRRMIGALEDFIRYLQKLPVQN